MIKKVNKAVSEYFNIDENSLYNHDRHSNVTNARSFAIYILHKKYNVSVSTLMNEYGFKARSIFLNCARIEDYLKYYKDYKIIYESICNMIK